MRYICKILLLMGTLLLAIDLLQGTAAAVEMIPSESIPQIQVNISEIGKMNDSFSVGQEHNWIIRCIFPGNPENTDRYTIIQTLSPFLTYKTGSTNVYLVKGTGERLFLEMGEHYTLTTGTVFVENGTADRLSISLTPAGSAFITDLTELRIYYQAQINENASMGMQILSTAQLNCTDGNGDRVVYISDKASVCTGGFHIQLTDASNNPLAGGKFMVARDATESEIADHSVMKELLDIGHDTIAVVYERFYGTEDLSGSQTDSVVTDEAGLAVIYGLAYGEYYIVQTEAPQGSGLSPSPVNVTVNEISHLTAEDGWEDRKGMAADYTIRIVNRIAVMPETGGRGTLIYTVSGTAVVISACMLLWINRKRRIKL